MASNTTTHYIRGEFHWAKVLGSPRLNEYTGEKEWTIDVSPDAEGVKLMKQLGIIDRLRDPKEGDDRGRFITFKQRELRKDGTPNDPIEIEDANGVPWDQKKLIGNKSVGDVKFVVRDYGKGKKKGVYIRAIRVLDHVPYVVRQFAPLSSDDEYFAAESEKLSAEAPEFEQDFGLEEDPLDDDLDDDIIEG